jgi:hypothetical protein
MTVWHELLLTLIQLSKCLLPSEAYIRTAQCLLLLPSNGLLVIAAEGYVDCHIKTKWQPLSTFLHAGHMDISKLNSLALHKEYKHVWLIHVLSSI